MLFTIKNQVRQSTLNIQKYFSWHHSRPLDLAIPFFLWRLFWNGKVALRKYKGHVFLLLLKVDSIASHYFRWFG